MQANDPKDILKNKYSLTLPYFNKERTQKFLGIVLTLIALSFFGFFAINPTISTILKLRKELSDNQFVYEQLETKIRNLSELRKQYANLQIDLPILTNAIPTQPDVHLLFAQIQTIAQQSNVKVRKLQNFEVEVLNNNKAPGKQYYSYSFSITGVGALENIYNFASTLTNMQRINNIEVFGINSIATQDIQSLEFNIRGIAFFKE
ncbi:MAG: type 4a pilus biogenesis protein PilO [Candidatus Levybacteria bacterium]|nr:type 4a pilus biogenesis protein PilO [Candidatus Levybacteria bacterium]